LIVGTEKPTNGAGKPLKRYDIMKKLTLTLAAVALAFSAATAMAMGGQADRYNERGYQSPPMEQPAITQIITG